MSSSSSSSSTGELSGIYFGILNIFTTLPQFVGTIISTVVFSILEPGKSPELAGDEKGGTEPGATTVSDGGGPNGIAVCLFIGAMSSLYAAYSTRKLRYL
jgi:solute carrier family 45, member 1/2/4